MYVVTKLAIKIFISCAITIIILCILMHAIDIILLKQLLLLYDYCKEGVWVAKLQTDVQYCLVCMCM